MIHLDIVEKLQKELKTINIMVREISGKALSLSNNGGKMVKDRKRTSKSLADSIHLFRGKVKEHESALVTLQEKVNHLHDLVTIYNEKKQEKQY